MCLPGECDIFRSESVCFQHLQPIGEPCFCAGHPLIDIVRFADFNQPVPVWRVFECAFVGDYIDVTAHWLG